MMRWVLQFTVAHYGHVWQAYVDDTTTILAQHDTAPPIKGIYSLPGPYTVEQRSLNALTIIVDTFPKNVLETAAWIGFANANERSSETSVGPISSEPMFAPTLGDRDHAEVGLFGSVGAG